MNDAHMYRLGAGYLVVKATAAFAYWQHKVKDTADLVFEEGIGQLVSASTVLLL